MLSPHPTAFFQAQLPSSAPTLPSHRPVMYDTGSMGNSAVTSWDQARDPRVSEVPWRPNFKHMN